MKVKARLYILLCFVARRTPPFNSFFSPYHDSSMSSRGSRSRSRSRARERSSSSPSSSKKSNASKEEQLATSSFFTLRVVHLLVIYVVGSTGLGLYLHHRTHDVWNVVQIALCFFLSINFLISWWEVCLWQYIDDIKKEWHQLESRYGDDRFQACLDFFLAPITLSEAFALRTWTRVWATYSLYDPSYSSTKSYGFWIDVGNGHSMLLPSVALCLGMTFQSPLSPLAYGVLGVICYYQMFYGCLLYFLSFFANGRHHGKSALEVGLFVGISNGIWIGFPLLGLWASIMVLAHNNWSIFI